MGICCSTKHQDYDGKADYTKQNHADIEKAIVDGNKTALKTHFENGFRTHHVIKEDKKDKRYLILIVEKQKIDAISDIPITFDIKTLLAEENGKKFYVTLLSNKAVLKNINNHYSQEEKVEFKVKGLVQNNEILKYLEDNKPEKADDPLHPVYKFLLENVFKKTIYGQNNLTPKTGSLNLPAPDQSLNLPLPIPKDKEDEKKNEDQNLNSGEGLKKLGDADNVQLST